MTKEQPEFMHKMFDQFMSEKKLFSKGSAVTPLLKNVMAKGIEAERESHPHEGGEPKATRGMVKSKGPLTSIRYC